MAIEIVEIARKITSFNQATLGNAIHWPQSRGGLHNPERTV